MICQRVELPGDQSKVIKKVSGNTDNGKAVVMNRRYFNES